MELNGIIESLKDLRSRLQDLRGHFDFENKQERLTEVEFELAEPDIWKKPECAKALNKEKIQLERVVQVITSLDRKISDSEEMIDLLREEPDTGLAEDLRAETESLVKEMEHLEFTRMFRGEMDPNAAFLDIQSGSGGTEAQDWAEMLLRMYLRFCEAQGFKAQLMEVSGGDVAGVKGATIYVEGPYAYGWLRTETGVHRLVRKSPFDANSKRHTSFASVFVSPEINDDIEVAINPADLRTDTYRASGAGGQHVNKTDSAIRITHIPTGVVVQCQNQRSQHQNRDQAMKMLKARLYELEVQKRKEAEQAMEDSKMDIGWGSQIRSYVLDQSRIKDLRTNLERTDTQKVLDGDLSYFIQASLKAGL
ncbi:MAG: peptide chain release factor 2 [Gammaproteobacteria bacterium]|nr:peptide chain release factor 2 [Gammaproteobacteria bacterium]